MNFVVLSSSRGTVFQAVLDRLADGMLQAKCLGLVTDKAERGAAMKANAAGLPMEIVERNNDESREEYDKRIHHAILDLGGDNDTIVACMGWMSLLSPWFVLQYRNRILNVHPSLLPKHPGTKAHDLVIAARDKESGMTIHLIDEGLDTGYIIFQKKCLVMPGDTADTLKTRVQALECEWYPKVLHMIHSGELKLPA